MRIQLTLILLFILPNIFAQQRIVGKLTHSSETPEGVSVILSNSSDKSNLIAYSFSNNKGEFELEYSSLDDSLVIATRSLNYKDTVITIENTSQYILLALMHDFKLLKEVDVSGAPIIAKVDTTVYTVANFATKDNQSIGDVIANMPGFTIDSNGKLSYMGKDIDKYYIEGLDLLEGRYTIANKNLSHTDVRSVEVLHNHQPIKMLRKKVFSDETSVNIKLKNKNTFSFRAKGAIGAKDLLYNINLSPMMFSPNHQNISSFQWNNIGDDLYTQFKPFTYGDAQLEKSNNNLSALVGIPSLAPNITDNKQRVYFNNSKLVSVNDLVKISDSKILKVNVAYYNDLANENSQLQTTFYNPTDTNYVNELSSNTFQKSNLLADLICTVNADEKYLNNQLRVEGNWDEGENTISNQQIQQQVLNPSYSVANELDVLREFSGFFLELNGFVDYDKLPQSLNIHPGVISDTAFATKQLWEQEQLKLKIKSSVNVIKNYWTFKTELGADWLNSELASFIEEDKLFVNVDSLQNKLKWQASKASINEGVSFEKNGLVFRANLPLNLYHYNVNDEVHSADTTFSQLFFAPSFFVRYKIGSYWEINMNANLNNSFGNVEQTTQGYAIQNYRTISRGVNTLPEYNKQFYRIFMQYKNPLAGWLFNMQYNKSVNLSNVVMNSKSIGNGVYEQTASYLDNTKRTDYAAVEGTYYLSKIRSTIGMKATYHTSKWQYILNNELNDSELKQPSFHANIIYAHFKFFKLKYNCSISYTQQKTPQSNIELWQHKHNMGLFFYINPKHWLSYSSEYDVNSDNKTNAQALFGDLTYAYKNSEKKINYKIKLRNIFNASVYNQFTYSDISTIKNSYVLRPREIILFISYKF
ncbi:hypothetical protein [Saccharicrinis aurantiacus]|uniref:hypothetical protein n=1 Tax=Saccharicrinis aurantiacus TaxID=1849719 RepID=UPI0024922505|nr:hypothetical protein [Saccharicrinis aurantiacus]